MFFVACTNNLLNQLVGVIAEVISVKKRSNFSFCRVLVGFSLLLSLSKLKSVKKFHLKREDLEVFILGVGQNEEFIFLKHHFRNRDLLKESDREIFFDVVASKRTCSLIEEVFHGSGQNVSIWNFFSKLQVSPK